MAFDLVQLLDHLRVTPTGENRFQGRNLPGRRKAVFGGQTMAQALSAGIQTVDTDRFPHSIHCHFLRAGVTEQPIDYQVARVRDGGSFSLRQVTALQNDKLIMLSTVSFQQPEQGLEHQQPAPAMVPRSQMISEWEFWQQLQQECPELVYLRPDNFTALEIFSDFRPGVYAPQPQEPQQQFWFRANGALEDQNDHLLVVTFQSDLQFMNTALHAHPYTLTHPQVHAASLDHSLWFFRSINCCEWLYYHMHSPVSAAGRGLNHGYLYTEEGVLVAAATQEGLIRIKD